MTEPWWADLRKLHDQSFEIDWAAHLRTLNSQPDIRGRIQFSTPGTTNKLPPSFFNGDVEVLKPREWILVISLNPAVDTERPKWYEKSNFDPDFYWHHWRTHNRRFFYVQFFRPLVKLAKFAFESEAAELDEKEFATTKMCFAEICPYAASQFTLDGEVVRRLLAEDEGFRIASEFRRILLEKGQPRVVFLNGQRAMKTYAETGLLSSPWAQKQYNSEHTRGKTLEHSEGSLNTGGRPVPVFGFQFLRRRGGISHNAYAEIDQLGKYVRQAVLA
jgi:hypothetical protein